jgi:hypothetical protein
MQRSCPFAALSALDAAASPNFAQQPGEPDRIPTQPHRLSKRMSTLPTMAYFFQVLSLRHEVLKKLFFRKFPATA